MSRQRISVTFDQIDLDCIEKICKKKKMSRSNLVKAIVEKWLDLYEKRMVIDFDKPENKNLKRLRDEPFDPNSRRK